MTFDHAEMLWDTEVEIELRKLQSNKLIADKEYWVATIDSIEARAGSPALSRSEFTAWLARVKEVPTDEYQIY